MVGAPIEPARRAARAGAHPRSLVAIYVAVHQIEANVIGPLVMPRAVHLHPAVIALGVVAVGEVFGFLGLLVAVPILSLTAILIDALWVRRRAA